jgi:hypothetical protein
VELHYVQFDLEFVQQQYCLIQSPISLNPMIAYLLHVHVHIVQSDDVTHHSRVVTVNYNHILITMKGMINSKPNIGLRYFLYECQKTSFPQILFPFLIELRPSLAVYICSMKLKCTQIVIEILH